MIDSKKLKKLHKFKLYIELKRNGKICLYNKFRKFSYYLDNGFELNRDIYINLSELINDLLEDNCFNGNQLKSNFRLSNSFEDFKRLKAYYINQEIHNEYVRFERCRKRIENMFLDSKNLFFLTFTLSNKYYDRYYNNQDNFMRYIKDFLKNLNCIDWCFNLDFGSKNDRLHAHCIISHKQSSFDLHKLQSMYKIGNLDIAKTYNDNSYALEKYITKFTNHSFKDTTLCRVTYSRNIEVTQRYKSFND